jgi:hypothetical protein
MSFFRRLFGSGKRDLESLEKKLEESVITTETVSEDGSTLTVKSTITNETLSLARQERAAKAKAGLVDYLYEWRTSEEHGGRRKKPCRNCKSRDGQIWRMTMWEAMGMPRSGISSCGEECTCELVKVGEYRWKEDDYIWYEAGYATEDGQDSRRKKGLVLRHDEEGEPFWEGKE